MILSPTNSTDFVLKMLFRSSSSCRAPPTRRGYSSAKSLITTSRRARLSESNLASDTTKQICKDTALGSSIRPCLPKQLLAVAPRREACPEARILRLKRQLRHDSGSRFASERNVERMCNEIISSANETTERFSSSLVNALPIVAKDCNAKGPASPIDFELSIITAICNLLAGLVRSARFCPYENRRNILDHLSHIDTLSSAVVALQTSGQSRFVIKRSCSHRRVECFRIVCDINTHFSRASLLLIIARASRSWFCKSMSASASSSSQSPRPRQESHP